MSILIAATVSLGQFCYDANKDIYAGEFMKAASIYEAVLDSSIKKKQSHCWDISNEKEYSEAKQLVILDSTGETLTIK